MKMLIFSRYEISDIKELLQKHSFDVVEEEPDIVLCWGGDGTFLLAESKYPGVPKLLMRKSKTCKKCNDMSLEEILPKLKQGISVSKEIKLQAVIDGKKLPAAMNDVVIRNSVQAHALRFSVSIDDKSVAENQIGDGIVIATPYGSTAYYKSITRNTFDKGLGVAFNNTVEEREPLSVPEDSEIKFTVLRGDGTVSVDTINDTWRIKKGDIVVIKKSTEFARVVTL